MTPRANSTVAAGAGARRAPEDWTLRRPFSLKTLGILVVAALFLAISGFGLDLHRAARETLVAFAAAAGYGESGVIRGAKMLVDKSFPIAIAEATEINRIEGFERDRIPVFTRIEVRETREFNALTNSWTSHKSEWFVHPFGYVLRVAEKMLETIEIAIWGTILSIIIAIPLGYFGARGYAPNRFVYTAARALCSFNRSIPELISALFFVLMYGFGPVAGILALGFHTSGFLGKFFADDIENADPGPQQAVASTGARKLSVLRYTVLPQVLPQYFAYVQYILERNVRTATVLGIVGAGGIGMELKGRWDMYAFDHVATILIAVFLTVYALEHLTQHLRTRVIGP